MYIELDGKKLMGRVCLLLVLCCFPANWAMMHYGSGWYNNNPEAEWRGFPERELEKGPSPVLRTISLITSPVSVPLNLIYWGASSSIPQETAEKK